MSVAPEELVGRGLDVLASGLTPYVIQRYKEAFGDTYEDEIKRVVGERGDDETLDVAALIDLIFDRWEDLFPERRGREGVKSAHVRTYLHEIKLARNRWAHQEDFSARDARRTLETMQLLLETLGCSGGTDLEKLIFEAMDLELRQGDTLLQRYLLEKSNTVRERAIRAWQQIRKSASIDVALIDTLVDIYETYPDPFRGFVFRSLESILESDDEEVFRVSLEAVLDLVGCFSGKDGAGLVDFISMYGSNLDEEALAYLYVFGKKSGWDWFMETVESYKMKQALETLARKYGYNE